MDRNGQIIENPSIEDNILSLIKSNSSITQKEICKSLKLGRTTITNIIRQMKKENVLERVGSDRKSYWKLL